MPSSIISLLRKYKRASSEHLRAWDISLAQFCFVSSQREATHCLFPFFIDTSIVLTRENLYNDECGDPSCKYSQRQLL